MVLVSTGVEVKHLQLSPVVFTKKDKRESGHQHDVVLTAVESGGENVLW